MNDVVTHIDPVRYLVDRAIEVIEHDTPNFRNAQRTYKFRRVEELKDCCMQRYTAPGYFIWAMVVNKRCITWSTSSFAKVDRDYNPFREPSN